MYRKVNSTRFQGFPRNLLHWAVGMLLVLAFVTPLAAQNEDPLLERFSLTRDDDRVLLNWVTRPGTTCEGVDVMRSTDSLNYETIFQIPGICGGPNDAFSYSYIDAHPVANRRNYYRLGLGRLGPTTVRAIDVVDLGDAGFQVRPNPVSADAKIYFANTTHERCRLRLQNLSGQVLGEWETQQEYFEMNGQDFQPGVYLLQICGEDGNVKAKGKLVVAR